MTVGEKISVASKNSHRRGQTQKGRNEGRHQKIIQFAALAIVLTQHTHTTPYLNQTKPVLTWVSPALT